VAEKAAEARVAEKAEDLVAVVRAEEKVEEDLAEEREEALEGERVEERAVATRAACSVGPTFRVHGVVGSAVVEMGEAATEEEMEAVKGAEGKVEAAMGAGATGAETGVAGKAEAATVGARAVVGRVAEGWEVETVEVGSEAVETVAEREVGWVWEDWEVEGWEAAREAEARAAERAEAERVEAAREAVAKAEEATEVATVGARAVVERVAGLEAEDLVEARAVEATEVGSVAVSWAVAMREEDWEEAAMGEVEKVEARAEARVVAARVVARVVAMEVERVASRAVRWTIDKTTARMPCRRQTSAPQPVANRTTCTRCCHRSTQTLCTLSPHSMRPRRVRASPSLSCCRLRACCTTGKSRSILDPRWPCQRRTR